MGFKRYRSKTTVAGDDNDLHLRKLPADQLTEGQPIHKGHPDIGDQYIRLHLADQGQGHLPVPGLPGERVAALDPWNRVPQGLPDNALVLYQKYAQQGDLLLHIAAFRGPPVWIFFQDTIDHCKILQKFLRNLSCPHAPERRLRKTRKLSLPGSSRPGTGGLISPPRPRKGAWSRLPLSKSCPQ